MHGHVDGVYAAREDDVLVTSPNTHPSDPDFSHCVPSVPANSHRASLPFQHQKRRCHRRRFTPLREARSHERPRGRGGVEGRANRQLERSDVVRCSQLRHHQRSASSTDDSDTDAVTSEAGQGGQRDKSTTTCHSTARPSNGSDFDFARTTSTAFFFLLPREPMHVVPPCNDAALHVPARRDGQRWQRRRPPRCVERGCRRAGCKTTDDVPREHRPALALALSLRPHHLSPITPPHSHLHDDHRPPLIDDTVPARRVSLTARRSTNTYMDGEAASAR